MANKEETRYKGLVEHLNDAVYIVDFKTLVFTSANSASERLTGYKKSELLKMAVPRVIAPEYLPLVKKMINLKRKARSTIYEIEIVKKDGSRTPVEISSVAIYENGQPVEILGVARDITERKIREHYRTIFVSLISHEIKNPLTTIIGYLGFMEKKLSHDKTMSSYISTMSQQAESINQLLSDFLDISQFRLGKFKISKEQFDLNEVIKASAIPFSKDRKIEIKGAVKKKITADKNRISQVLTNLLSNAVKYSDKKITVKVSETPKDIEVSVKDLGVGIAKANRKNVFELFVRSKDSKAPIKGHGIGLYICREIIKLHKGKLWLESTPAKGSTFSFTLPK